MSVKGAGNKSVAGNDNKSIYSDDRVNLIDLDYYSITEHITEKDLYFYPHSEFFSRVFRIGYSIYSKFANS